MVSSVRSTISARVPCQTSVLSPIALCASRFYCQPIGTLYSDFYGNAIRKFLRSGSMEFLRLGECGRLAPGFPASFLVRFQVGGFSVLLRFVALSAFAAAAMPLASQAPSSPADLAQSAERQLPALTETYKHLHENPELSKQEAQTAAYIAAELRRLGYTVTEHVGKYEDGTQAEGVVAVMEHGAGPRLLLRTELDALPVEEKTGLDYASHVKTTNAQGQAISVMHACGHDLHMTVLLGVASELMERKSQWHGTMMLIGQPAEETIGGAAAMLRDHLYERFGRPDYVLSEHDSNEVAAGTITVKGGPLLASSNGITVTMRGIGGHGSAPQAGKDPIVVAGGVVVGAENPVG